MNGTLKLNASLRNRLIGKFRIRRCSLIGTEARCSERCLKDDLAVDRKRLFAHVSQTQSHFFRMDQFEIVSIRIGAAAKDLSFIRELERRVVREAWTELQKLSLFLAVTLDHPFHLRTRPYKAHLAKEDIKKLRKLIQLILAKKSPHLRDPGIIIGRGGWPLVRSHDHRAELQQQERSSNTPCASAAVYHWPRTIQREKQSVRKHH